MAKRKGSNINDLLENQKQLEKRLTVQEDRNAMLEKKNVELKKENEALTKENDMLLNRLSQIAGEQMTFGNPNIADLSDPNRPTKIAEKWNNLYTDEWLEAYEEINKKSKSLEDHNTEKHLLHVTVLCYNMCQQVAQQQIQKIRSTLDELENYMQDTESGSQSLNLSQSRRISSSRLLPPDPRFIDNVINSYRQRRCRDAGWIEAAKKKCVQAYVAQGGHHSRRVLSYVNKCAELCWYMNVHDTPMVLECDSYKGQEIDRSKFNLYAGNGNTVDFIVWPALFLKRGQGLCLLAKGTVQPVSSGQQKKMIKRKSSDKMENVVSPTSIHSKGASNAKMGISANQHSHFKSSIRKSRGNENENMASKISGGNDVTANNSTRSRIANPDRLLSSAKSMDKLLSNNYPLQHNIGNKKNFMKSIKGK